MRLINLKGVFLILISLFLISNFVEANVVITEVMYAPIISQGGNPNEWVELYNNDSNPVTLSGWEVNNKSFDTIVINPFEYLVVAESLDNKFDEFFGNNDGVWNESDGFNATDSSLFVFNDGDIINLTNPSGSLVDEMTCNNSLGGDGNGKTLEYDLILDKWIESLNVDGTPGARNSIYDLSGPVITSLQKTPDPNYNNDYVYLNASITDLNLKNVWLESDFSGSFVNYTNVENDGSVYYFIISPDNFSIKQTINYRWYADDLIGYENQSDLKSFIVKNRLADIVSPILIDFKEDNIITINFSDYVTNLDKDKLFYEAVSPNNVTIEITEDTLTFIPDANWSGKTSFILNVRDEYIEDGVKAAAVILNVTSVNDAPWWDSLNINVDEDSGLNNSYDLSNYAWDVDNSSLIFNIEKKDVSKVYCNVVGSLLEFTPANNFTGNTDCVVSASDGENIVNNTINFVVNSINDVPWIKKIIPDQSKDEDSGLWTLDLTSYEDDVDNSNSELNWNVINVNDSLINVQIENSTDVVVFENVKDAYGSNVITFVLDDGEFIVSQDVLVTINPTNDEPSVPVLVIPADQSKMVAKSFNLRWDKSEDIDDSVINYHVYISDNISDISYYHTTTYNELVFNPEDSKIYYWYVKADDGEVNISSVINSFNTSFINPPIIDNYYPSELSLTMRGNTSQEFSINVSDPDGTIPGIKWYLDGNLVGVENSTNYSKLFDGRTEPYNVSVFVIDGGDVWKEWSVRVSDVPITNDFISDETTDFSTISDLSNAVNVVLAKDEGKISFSGALDLSDVFDIDGYVKIEKGVVAIDSSNLPQLNKKAVITLKNVGYKSIPKIYYNEGFTINENEIITECDFCNLISYDDFPTNNGEVIFEVSHFSSFKVGESGEEYDLSYFEDLDKCEEGIKGNLVVEIKEPDNGDDFKFGEKIEIEIVVDNNNEDDKDVIVEAILYNKDKDDGEEDVKSDEEEIEGKDDLSFDLEMNIPDDYDKSDDYILYVKAYEDGEEETQCNYEIVNLNLERESHDVVINEIEIMPKEINCGGSVQVNVKVENIGTKDEDDVYIRLENPELGIDLESSKFELDDYDGKNEKITKRFSLVIPENIKAKDYSLEGTVEFDDGSNSKLGILKIKDCEKVVEKEVLSVIGNTDIIKDVANIHLIIRNSMEDDILASVKVTNIGGWAENIIPQSISLHPGENNIYLHTDIKEEKKGKYTSIIEIIPKEGKIVKTNLVFDIKEKKVVVEEENIFDALIRWFEGIL